MNFKTYNEYCNTINDAYRMIFKDNLDKNIFCNEDKLKTIYKDISKKTHPDVGEKEYKDGELFKSVSSAYDMISNFWKQNPNSTYFVIYPNDHVDEKTLLNILKSMKDYYKAVEKDYRNELDDFERLVYFSSKRDMSLYEKEYQKIIDKLDHLLELSKLEEKLKEYVYENEENNKNLLIEFQQKSKTCKNVTEAKELYRQYCQIMQRNALIFISKTHLESLIKGYAKKYFSRVVRDFELEINKVNINNFESVNTIIKKYEEQIEIKKQIIDYYMSLKQIMLKNKNANFERINISDILENNDLESAKNQYENLKEKLETRIEFSKKVKKKLQEFLKQYKSSSIYSYTFPYIKKKVYSYLNYYNPNDKELNLLEIELDSLKIDFEKKKDKDIAKAIRKKTKLKKQFKDDFDNHIFTGNGLDDINEKINKINSFGGFANFSNKIISLEMSRVITDVGIYLRNYKIIMERMEDSKLILQEMNKAFILWEQARQIIEGAKDYNKIRIDQNKTVSYRKFSLMLQTLKKIDFYHANLDKIQSSLSAFDEFLNSEKYDRQLEAMINSHKRK